jgi:hypothetical protein
MRVLPRTIIGGIIIGAVLFFIPFLLGFILFALLIGFLFRLFIGRWWGWNRGYRFPSNYSGDYGRLGYDDIVPIDRQSYSSPIERKSPEHRITIR